MKVLLFPVLIFSFVTYVSGASKYKVYGKGINSNTEPLLVWEDAKDACAAKGLKLAVPKNLDEHNEIVAAIAASSVGTNSNFNWGGNDSGYNGVWLGLHKPIAAAQYKNFRNGEPNGGGDQQCIALGYENNDKWWDSPCNWKSPYVCGPGTSQTPVNNVKNEACKGKDGKLGVPCLLVDSKYDRGGAEYGQIKNIKNVPNACECQKKCQAESTCVKFVYKTVQKLCKLKNKNVNKSVVKVISQANFVIGTKFC